MEKQLREMRFIAYSTGSVAVIPKGMSEAEVDETRKKLRSAPPGSIITVGEIGQGKLVFLVQPLAPRGHTGNFLEAVWPDVGEAVAWLCARVGLKTPDAEELHHALLGTR